ncbi:hypothetical protein EG68_00657 [Paragonimus skrjabini miyazakii]|uniref:Cadherin domain-containing protein n=1 Tax=Paragonimus skrjabini miyazakii TaxID=59628 RepID=A0A8S9Z5E3_9TREM|nr:hypothetical protein EG68_00657 [Paragonimus skrjabini miyazakii]
MQNIVLWKWILNHFLIQQIVFTYGRSVHFVVNEEVPKGTTIGSLLDHVSGSFSNLKFVKLSSNDDASNLFIVDRFTGELSVASRLDRESLCKPTITQPIQSVYTSNYRSSGYSRIAQNFTENICQVQFNVNCLSTTTTGFYQGFSGGKLILLFDVFITIRDINDNGCSFIPSDTQTIEIREDSAVTGARLLLHSPFDPDDTSLGHSVHANSIKFHPVSKEFSLNASVFRTTETEFNQLFRLHIYSSNSTSLFSTETSISPIPFRLELELLRSLDFEQQRNYSFSILADDNLDAENHKCQLNVILLVQDFNDNEPIFKQRLYETDVSENTPVESLVVHVKATDADSGINGAISYRMLEASQETRKFFYLNPITGELRVRHRLNHRQKAVHEFRVVAENLLNGTRPDGVSELKDSSSTLVRLHVIDVNDHAPVIRLYSPTGSPQLEVMEESPPGQDVAVVDVTDNDSGDNALVECKLQNQSTPDALRLSSMDEPVDVPFNNYYKKRYKITVETEIDREMQSEVNFLIRCSDNGSNRLTTDHFGVINVIDINDNPPVFKNSKYSLSVSEDIDPSRVAQRFKLTVIEATDADIGINAKLRYSLDHGTPSNLLKLVKIDPTSGILSSTGNLDREQLERFSISIVVTDMGDPPKAAHTTVHIRVVDYNDNIPKFSKSFYTFSVRENSPIDQLVGVLTVSDADVGVNSQITILLEDAIDQPRLYGSHSGTIDQVVNFKKSASQAQNLINVTDQHSITNDLAQLRLVSYRLQTVQHEKIQNGSVYEIQLYTKSIWDREEILFRIKSNLPIGGGSKEQQTQLLPGVHLNNPRQVTLFPSNPCVVTVQVVAEDQGIPRLTKRVNVHIEVEDENDNSPVFKIPDTSVINITRVTVSYKEPKGFVFTQIYATDDDAGDNGTVNYFIQSGNSENYFSLDQYSGAIQIGAELSGYSVGEYMLHLEARDCGHPSRSAFGRLVVEIDRSQPKSALISAQYDPSRFGYLGLGATGYTFNLYILISIVVASGTISALLLVSICFFMRRSRRTRRVCRHLSGSSNGVIPNSSKPVPNPKAGKYVSSYPVTNTYHSGSAVDEHSLPYAGYPYQSYSPMVMNPTSGLDYYDYNALLLDGSGIAQPVDNLSPGRLSPRLHSLNHVCIPSKQLSRSGQSFTSDSVNETAQLHTLSSAQLEKLQLAILTGQEELSTIHPAISADGSIHLWSPNNHSQIGGTVRTLAGYFNPVTGPWSAIYNLESNSIQSVDCDSGHGDSVEIVPNNGPAQMTRISCIATLAEHTGTVV